jgi:adenylosuccinate lyase
MGARLTDSAAYAHLWGTEEVRRLFDDEGRLSGWLTILVELAGAQADLGIIPPSSAEAIARTARLELIDVDQVASETRRTAHSTLGLISALQASMPAAAAEHVYYGATVQDITDTWTVLVLRQVGAIAWRDLRYLAAALADLAETHRTTVMPGRTHGQPGAPITFGLKAASWADEIGRHLERLRDGRSRWLVGQLGGAVGTLGFFGKDGPALRARFCQRLGLSDPLVPWLTSRDRLCEFAQVLAAASATMARIGGEVAELQRPEIGELREGTSPQAVSSITMPHKRNPERSEHLDTLARLVRANAAVMLEGMVQLHERDGRGWKAEWVAFPEVCLLTTAALALGRDLVDGLEVDAGAMLANVEGHGGMLASEQVLGVLSGRIGKHLAQSLLQEVLANAGRDGETLIEAVSAADLLTYAELTGLVEDRRIPTAEQGVTDVVARTRRLLASEPESWP